MNTFTPTGWIRLAATGAACLIAGLLMLRALPALFGAPAPMVTVTWRFIAPAERADLERLFQLSEAVHLEGDRWAYLPLDTSAERLEALVRHPKVAVTDGVDRGTFRLADGGPLGPRRGGSFAAAPRTASRAFKLASYLFVAIGGALVLLGAAERRRSIREALRSARAAWHGTDARRAVASRIGAVLERGIPVASAEAAALFRIVFVTLVVIYVLRHPVYPELLTAEGLDRAGGLYGTLVRWLAAHPYVVSSIGTWSAVLGVLVVAGAGMAFAYPALVAVFVLWASVSSLEISHHVVSVLGVTLLCLLAARWADAWSVDAWLLRRRALAPSTRYGFTLWVPMLVIGLAFALAAGSKLRNGPDWVLNGSVKYHFVSDLHKAWTPWGVRLTRDQPLAVALSAAGVLLEALVITAAFSRSERYRLLMGLAAVGLLTGFALFHGVLWPGWWILLIGFLPWHRVRARPIDETFVPRAGLTPSVAQRAAVASFVVLQLPIWATQTEARPFLSAYDMYSTTYDSDLAFELTTDLTYRVEGVRSDGARAALTCTIDDTAVRVLTGAAAGSTEREHTQSILEGCLDDREDVTHVLLIGDRRVFDWESIRFEWKRAIDTIGPIEAGGW